MREEEAGAWREEGSKVQSSRKPSASSEPKSLYKRTRQDLKPETWPFANRLGFEPLDPQGMDFIALENPKP